MRLKKIALSTTFAAAAMFALAARPAQAQSFHGNFVGRHGAARVDVGRRSFRGVAPFRHAAPFRRFAPFPRFAPVRRFGFGAGFYPPYRLERVFVPFPFPHWIVERVYVGPGWGY